MSLKGTLDTMGLPDLLQWLGAARKTGVVRLSQGTTTKHLFLQEGLVIGSGSNDPSDFLGQLLLSYGKISEEQLRDALSACKESSELLGTHLVRTGIVTEEELMSLLAVQTGETIYSLFGWERAQFEYEDGPVEEASFAVALTVEDILLKGARRFDEMTHIREIIPSSAAIPRRTAAPLPPLLLQSVNLKRLAEAVDGDRSIAAIALQTHASEFLVSKFLYEGIRAGVFEIAPRETQAPRAISPGLHDAARRLFDAGDHEGVLTLVDVDALDPGDPLRDMVTESERRFVEEAFAGSMRPELVPALLKPTTELLGERLSPEEYFLISRIDGVWDIASIIAVSPLREVEALRVLRLLQKRGFIRLQDPVPAHQ